MDHQRRRPSLPGAAALVLSAALGAWGTARADEIELTSGKRYQGKLVQDDGANFTFDAKIGGGTARLTLKKEDVAAVTVGTQRKVVTAMASLAPPPAKTSDPVPKPPATDPAEGKPGTKKPKDEPSPGDGGQARSPSDVKAMIQQAGSTKPDWFDATPLSYPPTLALDFSQKAQGWQPQINMGAYIWSVINENPGKWKEGTRMLHHCLTVNKDNAAALGKTMNALGDAYHHLLEDWARAAFWWDKAGRSDEEVADSDWKLGCKSLAVDLLARCGRDNTRHGLTIKLWSDMGELDKALSLAEDKAKSGMPDIAYLVAGDACRLHGKFPEALVYYQQAANAKSGGRDIQQSKARAQASLTALKVMELLDLSRIPDGTYKADSYGYSGQVHVAVAVQGGRIASVQVPQHTEKQFYSSIYDTPKRIIAKQGVKGVDTTASATITSEAIINATAKALGAAMK